MINNVQVKICGLMCDIDVEMCMEAGVDILGFVSEYPVPVPWDLKRSKAYSLIKKVREPHKSCLVTGGRPEKVIELASELKPSFVQLHYKETLTDTIIISEALRKLNIRVIKTVPQNVEDRIIQFGTTDIDKIVANLCKTNVYALLADSRVPSNASEKGRELDLNFCAEIIKLSSKPVIVAGGITPGNVSDIINQTKAQVIDIMTGVESSPGKKEPKLVKNIIRQISGCWQDD